MTNIASYSLALHQEKLYTKTYWYSPLGLSLHTNIFYIFSCIISLGICWIIFIILRLSVHKIVITRNHTLSEVLACCLYMHKEKGMDR